MLHVQVGRGEQRCCREVFEGQKQARTKKTKQKRGRSYVGPIRKKAKGQEMRLGVIPTI